MVINTRPTMKTPLRNNITKQINGVDRSFFPLQKTSGLFRDVTKAIVRPASHYQRRTPRWTLCPKNNPSIWQTCMVPRPKKSYSSNIICDRHQNRSIPPSQLSTACEISNQPCVNLRSQTTQKQQRKHVLQMEAGRIAGTTVKLYNF